MPSSLEVIGQNVEITLYLVIWYHFYHFLSVGKKCNLSTKIGCCGSYSGQGPDTLRRSMNEQKDDDDAKQNSCMDP